MQLSNGPAPKPPSQRRRRNATVGMTSLPASGRRGRLPKWPLGPDVMTAAQLTVARRKVEELEQKRTRGAALTRAEEKVAVLEATVALQADAEAEMWRELWKTPQAVEWERSGYFREVAQYVRWKVLGESGSLDAAKEARQYADRLGLTPLSLARLRWSIGDRLDTGSATTTPPPTGGKDTGAGTVTPIASRRSRLSG